MKSTKHRVHEGRPALDLIEEAVHLLRTAPGSAVAAYLVGTLPFLLGLMFFLADMTRNPLARQHVVEAALGVTLLFVWMKYWHAIFARQLRAFASGSTPPPLTFHNWLHTVIQQTTLQPTGLFLLPLAALPVLPLAWVYAFYQNLTALGATEIPTTRELFRRSAKRARLWPRQNHLVLFILTLFAGFVFLNCCIGGLLLPHLLKTLLGIETAFSRASQAMLNTTFFATTAALTWLFVDPIVKAIYVLRCFYGDAVHSGADLRAELRQSAPTLTRPAACLVVGFILASTPSLRAADASSASPPSRTVISSEALAQAIDETIQQRKYTWRLPRERVVETSAKEKGVLARFVDSVGRMIRDSIKAVAEWLDKVLKKLFGGRKATSAPGGSSGAGWATLLEMLLYVLVAVVLSAIAFILFRLWRHRRFKSEPIPTEAIRPAPDLLDEGVGAEQLPEDGWTRLARELVARGELRLALRAFYLASLAHLAGRNLISLARFKSNHEYERELERRAHSIPDLRLRFSENVRTFDRVWYGTHEVTGELVTQFAGNVESIKTRK